jgi:hypothetical protein
MTSQGDSTRPRGLLLIRSEERSPEKLIPAQGTLIVLATEGRYAPAVYRRSQMSTIAVRTPGALATVVVLALLTAALTGCGVGPPTNKEEISKTAVTYLRALADGDTATACAQLTRAAKGSACEAAMKERLSGLESDALKSAADDSMEIEVHGATATAGLSEPEGARFVLKRIAGDWRIDSGYTLRAAASAAVPATPVGRQVAWALAQLNGRTVSSGRPT